MVVEPRQGLMAYWDRLVGPGMSRGETLLVLVASVSGAVFAGFLMLSAGASLLLVGLSALIAFDVVGGAVCNATRTTRAWYHRPGQTWLQQAAFVAPHLIYVIVVAAFLRGPVFDSTYAMVFGLGLFSATAAILCAPERLKTPVAFSVFLVVLSAVTTGSGPTAAMGWFEPALLLKLLLGHLVPDRASPPATALDASAPAQLHDGGEIA